MRKITTLFFTACFVLLGANLNAQYYFNTFNPAGQNPGGVNTDPEQPFGAAGVTAADGYTSIIPNGTTTLSWSPVQTIPFAFDFNGSPVTQYKVSNSGVLTFTTTATTVPSNVNQTIPSTAIPDNSVMIWGLQQFAGNDGVISKTHGTAPNRQHWINFASFSAPGASGAQWTYWGIVLEEGTNNIYIADLRTYLTPLTLTLGIQINSTTAYQVALAPNTPSYVTNGGNASDPSDNVYYEFIQGVRPVDDIELSSVGLGNTASNTSPIVIDGTITNKGSATLTAYDVNWSVDGGTTVFTDNITTNLTSNASANFTHSINWTPATAGVYYDVKVWTSNPNGNVDPRAINDTLTTQVFVNTGASVSRNVLLEEFTTAPCQFCPDGAVVVEQILATNPAVIAVGEHACFGTDAMTIPEASTYCSAFGSGAPTACVDRVLFNGETNVAHGRGTWATNCTSQAGVPTPVNVSVSGSYNTTTRAVTATVNADFVDYAFPGDLRLTLFVVEDSVTGTGSGYNQVNFYNNQAGHPYFGAGNPIIGFVHRHVLRDVYPTNNAWGDGTVIPTNPGPNSTYSKNYTFTLNNAWKEDDVSLVAFVSYFNTDVTQREVLNTEEVKLKNLVTGIKETTSVVNELKVYPNPTNEIANLEINLAQSAQVEISIMDLTGKEMRYSDMGVMAQGTQKLALNLTDLSNGFYFINLKVGNEVISRKISVMK